MTTCNEVELGGRALEYVRASLENGLTLSRKLLHTKDMTTGRVRALIPRDRPIEQIEDLTSGMSPEPPLETQQRFTSKDGSRWRIVPVPDTSDCPATIIRAFLQGGKRRICVLENSNETSPSARLLAQGLPVLVFGDEIYHIIPPGLDDLGQIVRTIREANTWLLNGALTVAPHGMDTWSEIMQINDEQIQYFADHASQLVIGAYDGEGFLLWSAL